MQDPRRRRLTDRLVQVLESMHLQLRPHSLEEWPELEVTMPQLRTLFFLGHGPRRMGEVASHLGTSLPSATSMIDRLAAKGLVERMSDPEDRRLVLCRLTPMGEREVEAFWRTVRIRVERVAGAMSLEELERVLQGFETLRDAVVRLAQGEGGPAAGVAGETSSREGDPQAS